MLVYIKCVMVPGFCNPEGLPFMCLLIHRWVLSQCGCSQIPERMGERNSSSLHQNEEMLLKATR